MTDIPAALRTRRTALIVATAAFVAIAIIAILVWLAGRRYVETDNAYVDAPQVVVTALIPAPVVKVDVTDTQLVKAGDVLVELDATDARLMRIQAEAQAQMARRKVSVYYANDSTLRSQEGLAQNSLSAADDAVTKAQAAVTAKTPGADMALAQAQQAQRAAKAQLLALRGQASSNGDLISQTTLRDHPEIVAAEAQLEQAQTNEARTVIRAPVAGIVSRSNVGAGQYVLPGMALMNIIPSDGAWVDANFKESQLRQVRAGQSVTLWSDLYGKGVIYHGTVAGISGGTGSTLALIPAQNATGNWIKVVQRIPVRITLDPKELAAHPVRQGMTMTARIDTGRQ